VVDIAQNMLTTRRGSLILGGAAAVLAAIVLLVYLHSYRNSVNSAGAPATVLVARNLIEKGTPGDYIGTNRGFQVASVPRRELQIGALTDPAALSGRVALTKIYPGQQLTANEFAYATPGSLQTRLAGSDRAITVQVDASHGMIGQIADGDHVDVFMGFNVTGAGGTQPVIKLLMADVLVLKAPLTGGSGLVTLRAPEYRAAQLAYAADNGRLWFVLRPASGAKTPNPGLINAQSLLNSKPVR
jgi:Flp pilus assembly protein CpaB